TIEEVDLERPGHDFKIHCHRPVANVLKRQAVLFRPDFLEVRSLRVVAPSEETPLVTDPERRPVSDPRTHRQDLLLFLVEQRYILRYFGARAHDAHLASSYVDKLREFIEIE